MKKNLLLFYLLTCVLPCMNAQNTAKPWAFWWWMGSAVNEKDISYNLEQYSKAGFGGLHIIPIYGVKGNEANNIDFLSDQWLHKLDFTCKKAKQLGLGIDMTMGTGWPFGGPWLPEKYGAQKLKINPNSRQNIIEYEPTRQQVKRAAPGGEGPVLDHFSLEANKQYFAPFVTKFSNKKYNIRAFYNDSYEVYGANWTPNFLNEFEKRRGYDLSKYITTLHKPQADNDTERRVWMDYHHTLSDLLYDNFNTTFTQTAHSLGKITRSQSHGSPANILDLYGLQDIPETEYFGSKHFDINGYEQDPDYSPDRFGTPKILTLKLASSPAHILGKKLVSCETATWLGNHFKVSLAQVKPIIDECFLGGVNHIFYHGATYSPQKAPYPGWLFYASTNFNFNSHFWSYLPELNKYIERCQTIFQNTSPHNQTLVLLPIYDLWQNAGTQNKTHFINVHDLKKEGLFKGKFGDLAQKMLDLQIDFDFLSDRQLQDLKIDSQNKIYLNHQVKYTRIIIPEATFLPLNTLKKLLALHQKGVEIKFINTLPQKSSGFTDYTTQQAEFESVLPSFENTVVQENEILSQLKGALSPINGIKIITKTSPFGKIVFLVNHGKTNQTIAIADAYSATQAKIFNPKTNQYFVEKNTKTIVLASGESLFILPQKYPIPNAQQIRPALPSLPEDTLHLSTNNWSLEVAAINFKKNLEKLDYWTNLGSKALMAYLGVGKYTTTFEFKNKNMTHVRISLPNLKHMATITVNGLKIGKIWCLPSQIEIPISVLKNKNTIEIEVQNLAANKIRSIDQQQVNWKIFKDINIVDINYKPFDASHWPVADSGLAGPVQIIFSKN